MTPDIESAAKVTPPPKKPQISFLLATAFGAGYLKPGPGTWGSVVGVLLTVFAWMLPLLVPGGPVSSAFLSHLLFFVYFLNLETIFLCLLVAIVGVWASSRVASYVQGKDPQFVVIDEVSGQILTLAGGIFGEASSGRFSFATVTFRGFQLELLPLLAGFVLFRTFDIWKPWPIKHLEKLPGGWGIMADDWLAGIYAAIVLRLALHFKLL